MEENLRRNMIVADNVRYAQKSSYSSPYSVSFRVKMLVWEWAWYGLCSWTPKPLNRWRLWVLRAFGCRMFGLPFVHGHAKIQMPWNLILHDRACLGDGANAYSLGTIEIKARATIAQEAYLCTGTHDFSDPTTPLVVSKITIEVDSFVGARAFVMPGVTIGARTIIGAASVVTKNMPEEMICAGNPCKPLKPRIMRRDVA
jgi:putative colanic acid biosynthesis acetyltransferase WcaF